MSTFHQGHIRAGENISSIGVTRSKIRGSESRVIRRHGGGSEDRARTILPREVFFGYITTTRGPYKYTRESSPIVICERQDHLLPPRTANRGKGFDRSVARISSRNQLRDHPAAASFSLS